MNRARPILASQAVAFFLSALSVTAAQLALAGAAPNVLPFLIRAAVRICVALLFSVPLRRTSLRSAGIVAGAACGVEALIAMMPLLHGRPVEPLECTLFVLLSTAALALAAAAAFIPTAGGMACGVTLLAALGAGVATRPALFIAACFSGAVFLVSLDASRRGRESYRRFPWIATLIVAITTSTVTAATLLLLPGSEMASRMRGWIHSSGGTETASASAVRGVGDGDEQVHGSSSPRSAGFDVGDTFANSDDPGLYDAFIETFGEPVVSRETPKMIGLHRNEIHISTAKVEMDFRNGKPLELKRSAPHGAPNASAKVDRQGSAIMWVTPPRPDCPCHIPLVIYDRWDVDRWLAADPPGQNAALMPRENWMTFVDGPKSALFGPEEAWEVRVGSSHLATLPLPETVGGTASFRVGRVNRADFFKGGGNGLMRMFHRNVPAGTVIETRSRSIAVAGMASVAPAVGDCLPGPAVIETQANAWQIPQAELSHQWSDVEAVIRHLRKDSLFDPGARSTATDGIAELLVGKRSGTALQFASTTALLLQSRGYVCRLIGGFYGNPARFDCSTSAIPIKTTDAHVWIEVRAADGTWVPFDPTPGFSVGRAVRFTDRIANWTAATRGNALWILTTALSLLVAISKRNAAADMLAAGYFRFRVARAWESLSLRRLAVVAIELLERRAKRIHRPRRCGETPIAFLSRLGVSPANIAAIESALYSAAPLNLKEAMSLKRALLAAERQASPRTLRSAGREISWWARLRARFLTGGGIIPRTREVATYLSHARTGSTAFE